MARDAKVELKKQVTLVQGVGIIVGIIIGSGIFVSPVGILQNVKSVGLSLLMWAICGLYNMLCALCYAELGASIPESGGEYIYIKRAFGDFAGFVCLWINFLLVCPVGIAAASLIFTTYLLKPIFSDCDIPESGLRLISALIVSKYFLIQGYLFNTFSILLFIFSMANPYHSECLFVFQSMLSICTFCFV